MTIFKVALMAVLCIALGVQVAASDIETRSLDELYAAALAQGGHFVLRAGGDKPDQIDYYLDKFKARFPELKVTHSVDVSLNHAPRYDNAREAGGKENVPDVIQFQTLHDFEYYKEHGLIEAYKPRHWDKVFPDHKDPAAIGPVCTASPSATTSTPKYWGIPKPRETPWTTSTPRSRERSF
ncbi:hypothetical protein [Algisphaera agarilytica]|uniref:Extracellular solute-binding protein n=1 Tax=Algisphaera agarilytica TaxID=1385975 RepID=A0A7X0LKJ4_9BACT|nr:hypothetical protein [Algisphaera agarilytica]MBB6429914.1 hypothetical protein [Algisphaera agarilytica]